MILCLTYTHDDFVAEQAFCTYFISIYLNFNCFSL